ncbi:MAG TPA: preprotein translocase subunit SecE [Gemmatimonadales bacterium]
MDAVQTTGGSWVTRKVQATVEFVREAWAELQRITWPTQPELKRATISIIVLAVVLGLAIGWLDKLLSLILVDGVARLTR